MYLDFFSLSGIGKGRVSASVSHDHQVIKNMIFLTKHVKKYYRKKHSHKQKQNTKTVNKQN